MGTRINAKYMAITILVILFLLLTFVNNHSVRKDPESLGQAPHKNSDDGHKNNIAVNSERPVVTKVLRKKEQCENISEVVYQIRKKWRFSKFPKGNELLNMGYSVDEVTLAIAHFKNKNFASSWRTNRIKSDSFAGKKDKRITDYFISILNDLEGSGFRAHYKYPQPELENFHQMSAIEKKQILTDYPPVVDDIAAFIRIKSDDAKKLTEDELLTLLVHIRYPEQIVSVRTSSLLSLLDYSVVFGYWKMFDYLIKNNLSVTKDWYLRTTLDRALRRLSYLLKNDNENKIDISNTVKMISVLMEKGAEAHIDTNKLDRITSNAKVAFPEFDFNQQQIQSLFENYQLDLTEIKKMTIPDMHLISDAIIDRFEKERSDFIQQELSKRNYKLSRKDCKAYIKADYFNKIFSGLF